MMVAIFLVRTGSRPESDRSIGLLQFPVAIVLALAAVYNLANGRGVWMVILPALMVAFSLVELLLDYIWHYPFRSTRLIGPYLLLFYVAQMGLIGYAFMVNNTYGFITLATYFLSLAASGYSISKVGHGRS
jgi:hypothetical protein